MEGVIQRVRIPYIFRKSELGLTTSAYALFDSSSGLTEPMISVITGLRDLKIDPLFKPPRRDQRFNQLLKRMCLDRG